MTSTARLADLVVADHAGCTGSRCWFGVGPGQVVALVALVGRSGAGESTTALALLGHIRPGLRRVSGSSCSCRL